MLFVVFGGMVALAAIALYASGTDAHNAVPSHFAAGLRGDRVNVLLITTEPQSRYGQPMSATSAVSLVSLQPSSREASVVDVPLHLWTDLGAHGSRPLGAAFEVGSAAGSPGGGDGLTVEAVERTLGVPIHGFVRFSLAGMSAAVARSGGVTIDAPRGVYDAAHRERFRRGPQRLDARRALLYGFSHDMVGFAAGSELREARARAVVTAGLTQLLALAPRKEDFRTNLTAGELETLGRLFASSSIATATLTPHLIRTNKKTAVYEGEAWVPSSPGAFRSAAASLLSARRDTN